MSPESRLSGIGLYSGSLGSSPACQLAFSAFSNNQRHFRSHRGFCIVHAVCFFRYDPKCLERQEHWMTASNKKILIILRKGGAPFPETVEEKIYKNRNQTPSVKNRHNATSPSKAACFFSVSSQSSNSLCDMPNDFTIHRHTLYRFDGFMISKKCGNGGTTKSNVPNRSSSQSHSSTFPDSNAPYKMLRVPGSRVGNSFKRFEQSQMVRYWVEPTCLFWQTSSLVSLNVSTSHRHFSKFPFTAARLNAEHC